MLLLYTRLSGRDETHSESKTRLHQSNLSQDVTDLSQEKFTVSNQSKCGEEIRSIQQVYHLERRFLL
ncbi:MAG TPA: hypothetical protein VIQ31_38960 [Phormidium sp.]